jgi:hypothetical protein
MPERDHLRLTREELYSLVWAKPMTQVAQEFEISDRAMAKLCAKRQVPVPPRGYWARKKAGQAVSELPLLAFTEKQVGDALYDLRRGQVGVAFCCECKSMAWVAAAAAARPANRRRVNIKSSIDAFFPFSPRMPRENVSGCVTLR